MTLVEIMVVIIIMTMIASAIGVAVFKMKEKADEKTTRIGAATLEDAAMMWLNDHPGDCPTPDQLLSDHLLALHRRTTDAWDHPYVIECPDDGPVATSAGHDGQMGTEDDITVTTRERR